MSTERYRRTPVMMHSIDADRRIEDVSDMWLAKLGYERSEVIGRPAVDFLDAASRRYAQEVVLPAFFANGRCEDIAYTFVTKDGRSVPVRLSAVAENDADGRFVRSLAVLQDVSEMIRLESKMAQSQKLESLGILAAGVAHDFNNLMVAILGNAELARHTEGVPAPAIGYLDAVMTTVQSAAELCRQLVAYSGKGNLVTARLALGDLCREVVDLLRVSVGSHATLELRLDGNPTVMAAGTEVRQVVMNLVLNAAEALRGEPGTVVVHCGVRALSADDVGRAAVEVAPGDFAFVDVVDEGCGMTDTTRERIFDPFYSTKSAGRGLGLAAVLGIVRSHRGTISVCSTPGRGTTMSMSLPLAAPHPDVATDGASPRAEGSAIRATVLVVDDEPAVRMAVSRLLKRAGHRVLQADNGEAALARMREAGAEIDVALVDVTMPGQAGPDVIVALRELSPGLPAVLMSGMSSVAVEHLSVCDPAGFLSKPFDEATLLRAVAEAAAPSEQRS